MKIDCFTFFNEFDILEGRLEYLYDTVDYFVLVESNLTHSGKRKPLSFMENMSRYKPYLDKVLCFPFPANPDHYDFSKLPTHDRDFENGYWRMENAQRNHIRQALEFFPDDAVVAISDVDEIPHKHCFDIAEKNFSDTWPLFALQQVYYAYNFKQKCVKPWHGTVMARNSTVKGWSPQTCRENKYNCAVIPNAGWHLTFWGGVEKIQEKLQSYAHQELNTELFNDPLYIQRQIAQGKDLFNREWEQFVPEDSSTINFDIQRIFGKYIQS
jgi:beta-1,4-mannosyl-glycoprotein beta-1,4-N-acetylglucosaminyltransferase